MSNTYTPPTIDEYLRKRLMPVEGTIPHVQGIEMYGNSLPAGNVGGDLFEYINFAQRYDVDARIQRAVQLSKEFLEKLPANAAPRNSVDDHALWLRKQPGFTPEVETEYRKARSSEQVRVAEDLKELYTTAGVLLVDAEGHGIIRSENCIDGARHVSGADAFGTGSSREDDAGIFREAQFAAGAIGDGSQCAGKSQDENTQEIATMLYGEVRPYGLFRFVNFGHPPPLVFSAEYRKFMDVDRSRMVQFLPLGVQIPEDHPDRKRYLSLDFRKRRVKASDLAEMTLMSPGDIFFLYTDGVFDGSDKEERAKLENVMRDHYREPAKDICNALLDYAAKRDEVLRQAGEQYHIDDKTVFIIKRN